MTKQQAIELEANIDKLFSEKLETDCEVSIALAGALRISLNNGFININSRTKRVAWVKWNGDYDELQNYINKIIIVITGNEEKIEMLINSYKMKPFLNESE